MTRHRPSSRPPRPHIGRPSAADIVAARALRSEAMHLGMLVRVFYRHAHVCRRDSRANALMSRRRGLDRTSAVLFAFRADVLADEADAAAAHADMHDTLARLCRRDAAVLCGRRPPRR